MDEEILVIASSANERFAMGLKISLCSIVLSNPDTRIRFYVVDDGMLTETRESLIARVADLASSKKVEIRFLELSDIKMPELPAMKGNHASYARLFFAELLSESSIYYVDADIICNRPFVPLTEMESLHAHHLIAGCRDDGPSVKADRVWAEKCGTGLYVNAGLLWMNLSLMREDGFGRKVFADQEIIEGIRKKITPFHDQTLINCHCHGRVGEMQGHFNVVGSALYSHGMKLDENWHFTGEFKPWLGDGMLDHLTIHFYLYHTMVSKLGLAAQLPYSRPYLPLSNIEYMFRHLIAARLWFRSRKRFRRFLAKVECQQTCRKLAGSYAARIDQLMDK